MSRTTSGPIMSGNVEQPPPYNTIMHFRAAFGGAFGSLNLLVGAASIFRQIVRAFDVGVSPVLKNIFAAYVQIFHGLVEILAGLLSRVTGLDFSPPPWAHDWIILWFVMAGAASRLILAATRARFGIMIIDSTTQMPGLIGAVGRAARYAASWVQQKVSGGPFEHLKPPLWTTSAIAYLFALCLWPLILLELVISGPTDTVGGFGIDHARISYLAIFWLQTIAIVTAVFGLSVLNAQTLP